MKRIFALVASLVLFAACASSPDVPTVLLHTSQGTVAVQVELATTPPQRAQGLMLRESLGTDQGMLFIFDTDAVQNFWMKNTLIPLDMIFIDSQNKIVHIEENAQPCQADPCKIYSSAQAARYVLEVNGGFTQQHGVKAGDEVEIPK